jgi:type I restriction enzyme M protein
VKSQARSIDAPQSSAQQLGVIVKACRDIMRKDKGLNGDLDRLPMLTWIMFLKFLDDMEVVRETEAKLAGKRYRPSIEAPYRWRDWAAKAEGITGPELIAFINQDEAVRADGKRGAGLFAYLRSLESANGDRRDVISRVFQGTVNRMVNGYLLRDVVNRVNDIQFASKDEIHTLSHLYETLLREMRDAAGDSGEFYTPRPLVKFIVGVMNPRLGEVILDPAAGTGGFLVEAFEHLRAQAKRAEDYERLQRGTLQGIEAKPLPYLLCEMNLLLHGMEYPEIDPGNALRFPLREIGDRDRVDVIMTNPPFGGQEEKGIQSNFSEDKQTAETALLFLQLIMRKLRRLPNPGRAAVVVPNGTLSADGVAIRIREELLSEFSITAVVRLPHNVFAPYTDIKTNVLFFQRGGPTEEILYCEPPLPAGLTLSKTKPLLFEWIAPYISKLKQSSPDEHCWIVRRADLGADLNLDLKNPRLTLDAHHAASGRMTGLVARLNAIADGTRKLQGDLERITAAVRSSPIRQLGELTKECDERIGDNYEPTMRLLGVSTAEGFGDPKGEIGKDPKRYKIVRHGYLAYNPMRINIGSIGVSTSDEMTGITSPDYVVFRCLNGLLPEYVFHYLRSEAGRHEINQKTKGSVRFRLYYKQLAEIRIPVPEDTTVQRRFADLCRALEGARHATNELSTEVGATLDAVRREAFLAEHT